MDLSKFDRHYSAHHASDAYKLCSGIVVLILVIWMVCVQNYDMDSLGSRGRVHDIVSRVEQQRQDKVKVIDGRYFSQMLAVADTTTRKRQVFDFTTDPKSDTLMRFINAWRKGSYARVHRHTFPEALVVLEGLLALLTFHADGRLDQCHVLGPGTGGRRGMQQPLGVDVAAGVWHTMTALTPGAVVWETSAQEGGYRGPAAKEFAEWAPLEGSIEAAPYLHKLLQGCKT